MRSCVYIVCVLQLVVVAGVRAQWFVDSSEGSSCVSPRGLSGFCRQRDNCLVRASDPPPASADNYGRALCGSLGPGALVCCEIMRSDVLSVTTPTTTTTTTTTTSTSAIEEVVVSSTEETTTAFVEPHRRPVGERSTIYCLANLSLRQQPWWENQEYRLRKKQVQPWWRESQQLEERTTPWWLGGRREERRTLSWLNRRRGEEGGTTPDSDVPSVNNGVQTAHIWNGWTVNDGFGTGSRAKNSGSGGSEVYYREFPHTALLGYLPPGAVEVTWHCGGSLISDRFVLSAAHCFGDTRLGAPVLVRLGEHDISRPERTERDYGIERTWIHPQEETGSNTWYHDLALIKLNKAVKFNRAISPACLSTRPEGLEAEEGLVVSGWGSSRGNGNPSQILLKGSGPLSVIPRNECARYYRLATHILPNGIHPGMFCAADLQGDVDTCQGDSGGPIQLKTQFDNYVIVGVTTAGVRFCGERTPTIYTRVSFYLDWIENIVWPEPVPEPTPETVTEPLLLDA